MKVGNPIEWTSERKNGDSVSYRTETVEDHTYNLAAYGSGGFDEKRLTEAWLAKAKTLTHGKPAKTVYKVFAQNYTGVDGNDQSSMPTGCLTVSCTVVLLNSPNHS